MSRMVSPDQVNGLSPYIGRGREFREAFETAHPFPHIVLDGFLESNLADELLKEFPAIDAMPKSRDYVFSDKRELSSIEEQGPAGAAFHRLVMSDEFQTFLVEATGIDGLFIDPQFFGGGFHQGGDGSYLDLHTDFNLHPLHKTWHRRLNILLYLNPDWRGEDGGAHPLKKRPRAGGAAAGPPFYPGTHHDDTRPRLDR